MEKFGKKISAVILSLAFAAASIPAYAVQFSDIADEQYDWARPYINEMADRGYITGYEDGTFGPDNEVTRLECLALFARAMGCKDTANEPVLELAHDRYDSVLRNYSLSWGKDEIAYMMYKGALKRSDLDTYLMGSEKNEPMKRYEAAIVITKAMGGEREATSDYGVMLSYSDARDIPSSAIQYVQYATDKGIMQGVGDGEFAPDMTVSRSQMAVMLSRAVDRTNYNFITAKLAGIDMSDRLVIVKSGGNEQKLVYSSDTVMRAVGDTVQPSEMLSGVSAVFTLSGSTLKEIDALSSEPDQSFTGLFKSSSSFGGIISVKVVPTGENRTVTYECANDVAILFDGSPATMRSFSDGTYVTLDLVNGKVEAIRGEAKSTTITAAKVESLDVGENITITISHGDEAYNGSTYVVANNVSVVKNSLQSDLRSIYAGDTVTLTLEYGIITKISATSKTGVIEGNVQAITISSTPKLTIRNNGQDTDYDISSDVEIYINGDEAKLTDFNVGDKVKLTIDSNAVTKITADTVQDLTGTAIGIISGVNSSYKVITVQMTDGSMMQFQCPDSGKNSTAFITLKGGQKKIADIKTGDSVEVKYNVSNGVYVATLVILLTD